MVPVNNSDTAWLIVSDYNQDNDLPYEDLREDILNPEINDWIYSFPYFYNGEAIFPSGELSYIAIGVGGGDSHSWEVGYNFNLGGVGTHREEKWVPAGKACDLLVGGNLRNYDTNQ